MAKIAGSICRFVCSKEKHVDSTNLNILKSVDFIQLYYEERLTNKYSRCFKLQIDLVFLHLSMKAQLHSKTYKIPIVKNCEV